MAAKLTDPVGTAVPAVKVGVTVAVNATGWLTVEALGVDTTLVVVASFVTTWLTVGAVPDEKF
jgi:hypothetical protein